MNGCDQCGRETDGMLHSCNYCSANLCPEHRLPENHDCLAPNALAKAQQQHREEPEPRPPGANHETCRECLNAVAPGKDLCPDCQHAPSRYSSGDDEFPEIEPETDGGTLRRSLRYNAEIAWIRIRGWITSLVLLVVVFGGFLSGLYVFMTRDAEYFGHAVPAIDWGYVHLHALTVSPIAGLAIMLAAIGIGLKIL